MNLKDWQKGRNDGLALALKIVKEGARSPRERNQSQRGNRDKHKSFTERT